MHSRQFAELTIIAQNHESLIEIYTYSESIQKLPHFGHAFGWLQLNAKLFVIAISIAHYIIHYDQIKCRSVVVALIRCAVCVWRLGGIPGSHIIQSMLSYQSHSPEIGCAFDD